MPLQARARRERLVRVLERVDPDLTALQVARVKLQERKIAAVNAVNAFELAQREYDDAERRVTAKWWPFASRVR